jgi:tetratricopeptide (TPR) repeat protein
MELRHDTAKRYPHTQYQSLVEQMRELRKLRKLVRNAEATGLIKYVLSKRATDRSFFRQRVAQPITDDELKQALAAQLGQSPFLDIFSEDRVRDTLKFMGASQDTRVTRDVAKDICAREGIKAMLLGTISSVGAHYSVVLLAENSQTSDIIATEQFDVEGKEQVLKSLGAAASRLREKLGESLNDIKKYDAPIEKVTTPSLEALRQYSLGVEQHSKADYKNAIPLYQRAIESDQNFAIAHVRLANCYNNTGQLEASRVEFTKAYELVDRVSEREKFLIRSSYFGGVLGQWEKQIDELEAWKHTYQRDWEPLNLLASKYSLVGPFERGIQEGNQAIAMNPRETRAYVNVGVSFIQLNMFDEAKDILRKAETLKPESTNMHMRLYQIAFVQSDAATMKQQIDWANASKKAEDALIWQARTAGFSGQLANADQMNDRVVEMFRTNDAKESMAREMLAEAVRDAVLAVSGQLDRAPGTNEAAEALWKEAEGTGVHVTCLCPGPTVSQFRERVRAEDGLERARIAHREGERHEGSGCQRCNGPRAADARSSNFGVKTNFVQPRVGQLGVRFVF